MKSVYRAIRDNNGLNENAIMAYAPSVYSENAHYSRAQTYGYIPTFKVLDQLKDEGFIPVYAAQQCVRDSSKIGYTRHMLRFIHPDMRSNNEGQYEVILFNSHDGTSAFRLATGFFRFVCCNGLWIGTKELDVKVYHRGTNVANEVIEGAFRIVSESKRNAELIEYMRDQTLDIAQRIKFANEAIKLRFGDQNVVTTDQVLFARRIEDRIENAWNVFNRVQENLINGGMYGRSKTGKMRKVRALVGLTKSADFNAKLWQIMQSIIDTQQAIQANAIEYKTGLPMVIENPDYSIAA